MIECASSAWLSSGASDSALLVCSSGIDVAVLIRIPAAPNKWQPRNLRQQLLFRRNHFHARPRLKIIVLHITERDSSIQARRKSDGRNAANLFVVARKDLRAFQTHF